MTAELAKMFADVFGVEVRVQPRTVKAIKTVKTATKPKRRKPVRDRQRRRLYRWEMIHWPAEGERDMLTLAECKALVTRAWLSHGRPNTYMPRIEDGRGRRRPCASRSVIKLPRWGRFAHVILHEVSHSICDQRFGHIEGHGPEFVGLLIHLLDRYTDLDHDVLWHSAVKAGLRVTLWKA